MKLPNKNNHSRSLSITKKLLFYLSVFTVLLFLVIYVVLTVFLEPFYQGIKRAELNEAKKGIALLGGRVERCVSYIIPGTEITHSLILLRKERPTPPKYPRRWAQIKKQPL